MLYTAKSSAVRAARKNAKGEFEIYQEGDQWGWRELPVEPVEQVAEEPVKKQKMKGAVRMVWDIAEQHYGKKTRSEIIALCVEAGINYYTARTQYQAFSMAMRGLTK